MSTYQRSTVDMVAAVLSPGAWLTPREIEPLLPFHLERVSIRGVLSVLVRDGRAVVEGDVSQRRYRAAP